MVWNDCDAKNKVYWFDVGFGVWEWKNWFWEFKVEENMYFKNVEKTRSGEWEKHGFRIRKGRKILVLVFMRFWGIMMEKWFLWI